MLRSLGKAGELFCWIGTVTWILLCERKMCQNCLQNIATADICHDFTREKPTKSQCLAAQ